MSWPVVAIRPQPGCRATVEQARTQGLEGIAAPLFEVRPVPWDPPAAETLDALLLGSANAVRHGGPELELYRGKPVYAVGEATAQAVRSAGFTVAATGQGGLQALLERTAAAPLRLLRLAGEERIPLTAPPGVEIETRVVYRSVPLPVSDALAEQLRAGALVLLHSAVAALHFAGECDRQGVPRGAVALAALGPRIAAAAGEGWRDVRSASEPREAALLALARDMCHELGTG